MSRVQDRLHRLPLSKIADADRSLSAPQVAELERLIGCSLPADYREFAELVGGCGFDGEATVAGYPILQFFGAPAVGRRDDLFWNLDTYADELPEANLVIARDEGGNRYVLDVRTGKVFFLDFDSGGHLILVAESFADCLDLLNVSG